MLDMWISNIEQICDIYLEGDNMSVLCLQLLSVFRVEQAVQARDPQNNRVNNGSKHSRNRQK